MPARRVAHHLTHQDTALACPSLAAEDWQAGTQGWQAACIKKVISKTKPSRTDQYKHKRKRIYRSKNWWQSVISGEIKLASVGRCLLLRTGGRCCAPSCRFTCCSHAITFLWTRDTGWDTVPSSPWYVSMAQLHQPRAKAQGSLKREEDMNIWITAWKKKNFEQLSKEENRKHLHFFAPCVWTFRSKLSIVFPGFTSALLGIKSCHLTSLESDTLS